MNESGNRDNASLESHVRVLRIRFGIERPLFVAGRNTGIESKNIRWLGGMNIVAKRYEANWESLSQYTVPEWFKDAKLGIFIHWGIYAVPAFGSEWYPRNMYRKDSPEYEYHLKTWGRHKEFGYKDFIPMFKAEKWDPEAWVDLFKRAGARYIVPVGEHHDGFPMYDSAYTRWNAAKMGPCRDVIAELEKVVRREGLKFGVSSHRAFNWRYFTFDQEFDTVNPEYAGLYGPAHPEDEPASREFLEEWFGRTKEIIDRFRPDVLWFDFGWHFDEFAPYRPRVAAYYYNRALEWGKEVVLNYKEKFPPSTAVYDIERGKLSDIREHYWQTDTSVSYKSWGYIENDEFKSVTTLVHDLVDIVSKNGNLLLNVGPKADGTIPDEAAKCLLGLGEWLKINGEAIYGTRHWWIYGEGPTKVGSGHFSERENEPFTAEDIRFTCKGDVVYAIVLGWPEKELTIKALARGAGYFPQEIRAVQLLGSSATVKWKRDTEGLKVSMPATRPCDHAYVLKVIPEA